MNAASQIARVSRPEPAEARELAQWSAVLSCILVAAALTSTVEDWQPIGLVLALGAMMVLADVVPVTARRIRLSAGLMARPDRPGAGRQCRQAR
jgi:hypothetical protein